MFTAGPCVRIYVEDDYGCNRIQLPPEGDGFLEDAEEDVRNLHLGIASLLDCAKSYQFTTPNVADDWGMMPPTTRAEGDKVDPGFAYMASGALLTDLENSDAALFSRYAAIRDLTDLDAKKDIAPFALKNVGRNTPANMAALSTLIRATGFASPRRTSTGVIQIHMHRSTLQLKGSVENACALFGTLPHQFDMVEYMGDP